MTVTLGWHEEDVEKVVNSFVFSFLVKCGVVSFMFMLHTPLPDGGTAT